MWIQMEICGPTLRDWLDVEWDQEKFDVQLMQLGIVRGLVEGVRFLHRRSVIHRDLKPENVFFSKGSDSGKPRFLLPVKIGDLGLSRRQTIVVDEADDIEDTIDNSEEEICNRLTTPIGTYKYMAPEVRETGGNYGFQADLFSLGLIIWEVLALIRYKQRGFLFDWLVLKCQHELVKNHELIKNAKNLILSLTIVKIRCVNIEVIKIETKSHLTFESRNSTELSKYLEICSDGDTINLLGGRFHGEFVLNRNNIIVQGISNIESVIISDFWGLFIVGHSNIVRNLKFESCFECVRIHGNYNSVHNLAIHDSNIGIMTYSPPIVGTFGSFNKISNITFGDFDNGIILYGEGNKIRNVVFKPVNPKCYPRGWIETDNGYTQPSNCCMIKLWGGSGHLVGGMNSQGFSFQEGDLGLHVGSSLCRITNSKCGPIRVSGHNNTLEKGDVDGIIEILGDGNEIVHCVANIK